MLAKWFRLSRWTRAAILCPAFAAIVFALDIAIRTRPMFPTIVILPVTVILPACLLRHRQNKYPDTGKMEDPGV